MADLREQIDMTQTTHSRTPVGGQCTLGGCARSHYASGYCNPHWRRWKRTGDPGPALIAGAVYTCSFGGCGRPRSAKGLCASHYAQQRKGNSLTPLNDRVNPRGRDAEGNKRCATCKQWKPTSAFRPVTRTGDGFDSRCTSCAHDLAVRKLYGISAEQYSSLLEEQGGGCAICGGTNESGRAMAVDHDHSCCSGSRACGRCVRGLLCSNCNMAIGLLRDDPVRVRAAADYLIRRRR
ncbi:endonuclease VII domain-containing protein [Streptomyces sp. NPDC050439]|uniref:endonuclease VII domain-containing protein n=1 Tax=unclassified Streptomyces TaxID=2593676 RepID=UPI00342ED549